jgi:hypothetical protein
MWRKTVSSPDLTPDAGKGIIIFFQKEETPLIKLCESGRVVIKTFFSVPVLFLSSSCVRGSGKQETGMAGLNAEVSVQVFDASPKSPFPAFSKI